MYVTMSISTGFYPNLDLKNVNKLYYIALHIVYYSVYSKPHGVL